jgi:hypothetical protein
MSQCLLSSLLPSTIRVVNLQTMVWMVTLLLLGWQLTSIALRLLQVIQNTDEYLVVQYVQIRDAQNFNKQKQKCHIQ